MPILFWDNTFLGCGFYFGGYGIRGAKSGHEIGGYRMQQQIKHNFEGLYLSLQSGAHFAGAFGIHNFFAHFYNP